MIENFLEKNFIISNNKIKERYSNLDGHLFKLINDLKTIFNITEDESFNNVFNFLKKYGYDLEGGWTYFNCSLIKISDLNLSSNIENKNFLDICVFGSVKNILTFNVIGLDSLVLFKDIFSEFNSVSPTRYEMYHKGVYFYPILISSIDYDSFDTIRITAECWFTKPKSLLRFS